EKDSTLLGLFKTIKILIDKGYYTDAQKCLNRIHLLEGPTHSDQCKLNGIRLYLAQNNLTWHDLSPAQLSTIYQIYQNNPETAIEARAILSLTKGLEYANYPYDVQEVRSMDVSNSENIEDKNSMPGLKVYPNPATDFTKVEIRLSEEVKNPQLVIYNLLGSEILKKSIENNQEIIFDMKDFNTGIYFFVLKTENGIVEKQKVIVSR
ncbi:MAG TPA: T9SS type A sorting domain-containing protein, partial [Bacteroidia bacterium]|nr:T9SS type A sorting domain-containing protein [Bacteroidia bacterium]